MRCLLLFVAFSSLLVPAVELFSQTQEKSVLDPTMHHLRRGPIEWSEFPEKPESESLELRFKAQKNPSEYSLKLRQQDVKQTWHVRLNDKPLGRLEVDESDRIVYFAVPAETLVDGENRLSISQDERRKASDDIRVGEIELDPRSLAVALNEAHVSVEVRDMQSKSLIPARITVLAKNGALQTTGAKSNSTLAVRPGLIYTSNGQAVFGLPAGEYQLFAGRGFEYSLASTNITLSAGDKVDVQMSIEREVPTQGYVASDTHIHTLTHSGHGDATIEERMITLAGEGIELPIATDHNVHINYEPIARSMHVRQYFTPVIGNEVTTTLGHFNVFPVEPNARVPDARLTSWAELFPEMKATPGVRAIILNHARDIHSGVRPFGPDLHNAETGENLKGWKLEANAMEVVNSGATQTDPLQLLRDWMTMLNRGHRLTPVGGSDSHDVGRHFVGQARTYIRANDEDPGNISIEEAVTNFVQGQVMVSYGLLAELIVNDKFRSGQLVKVVGDELTVSVRVLGPHWVEADTIQLYANGRMIKEQSITKENAAKGERGVKWSGTWTLPRPNHDMHLVAIATGPGIDGLYWKTAKPYQPQSPDWEPRVIGCSGAVWIDGGRGKMTKEEK